MYTMEENGTLFVGAKEFSPYFLDFRRANIMKPWEHQYFKTHPDYLKLWVKVSEPAFNKFHKQVDLIEAYAEKTYEQKPAW